jgi:hypothetical protein
LEGFTLREKTFYGFFCQLRRQKEAAELYFRGLRPRSPAGELASSITSIEPAKRSNHPSLLNRSVAAILLPGYALDVALLVDRHYLPVLSQP